MNDQKLQVAESGRDESLYPVSRREFLKGLGGGIVIFFTVGAGSCRAGRGRPDFNDYLRVGEDGRVTCFTGKIEMGQGPITSLAQTLADAGASLIIGHHPHVVQSLGYHQTAFTTYSLGNFVFDQGFSEETSQGLALRCLLDASGVKMVEFLPVYITDCQPRLMSPEDGAPVLERILAVTEEQGGLPGGGR